jgi:hypothetical protein
MSRILKLGVAGPDIGDVQRRLNCRNPTRLPRLNSDNLYGVLTMARVMEFQFQQRIQVDGACGPETQRKLVTCDNPTFPKERCILVDLIHEPNRLVAFKDGKAERRISRVHGGSAEDPSTRGVFPMTSRRLRHHTSAKFPEPPDNMQFSMFYNGGEAIHQGPPTEPSHGCIHVGAPDAEGLFNWAGNHNILVIVVKRTR